ncbi:MAG TPA: DUF4190 domain-containing protein [Candidatus Sulfotelmatobacter sp.]|nr:DUF4190 domain-containing protein [Candidatus Sulfotelmatobacter sp.]
MSSFCLGCGNSLAEGEQFCGACGRDSLAGAGVARVDPEVAFGLPPETSGKAIFSLICGTLFIILPLSIVALIFGYLALSEIRKSPGRLKGRGLAIAGIVLGYLGVACIAGLFGLGFYAVRKTEKEITEGAAGIGKASVVSSMRSVNMAEIAYVQAHPEAGYTCALSELAENWGARSLASGRSDGYIFELKNCAREKSDGPVSKYQLLVYPARPVSGAARTYCTDQSDMIRVLKSGDPNDCFTVGSELSTKEINGS